MTPSDLRRLALALPGTEESSHMGAPDFRVGGRIFASASPGAAWRGTCSRMLSWATRPLWDIGGRVRSRC